MSGITGRTDCSALLVAIALALVAPGCDNPFDTSFVDLLGFLEVTTVTGGANIDPDGYELRVTGRDAVQPRRIGANETVLIRGLSNGDYTATLDDIATNCSVDANPQVETVPESGTGFVTFNVTCS